MANKKLIVVFGATGNQGGSVVKSILSDPKTSDAWTVKAVTRDTSKPSAQALKELGAELVAADLNDASTLGPAVKGADAVFAVTNYWESMDAAKETAQGKAIADAAHAAKVSHFIWSGLPNATEISDGTLKDVKHFDSKAAVTAHIKSIGLPYTIFMPAVFVPALANNFHQTAPNNAWTLSAPYPSDTKVPILEPATDTGKYVKGILLNKDKTLGTEVLGAAEYISPDEMLQQFKEIYPKAGVDAIFVQQTLDSFKKTLSTYGVPEQGAHELAQNMQLIEKYAYYGSGADLKESHSILVDDLITWRKFIQTVPNFAGLL